MPSNWTLYFLFILFLLTLITVIVCSMLDTHTPDVCSILFQRFVSRHRNLPCIAIFYSSNVLAIIRCCYNHRLFWLIDRIFTCTFFFRNFVIHVLPPVGSNWWCDLLSHRLNSFPVWREFICNTLFERVRSIRNWIKQFAVRVDETLWHFHDCLCVLRMTHGILLFWVGVCYVINSIVLILSYNVRFG